MTLDTPANRILKAALIRCFKYLNLRSSGMDRLAQWARQSSAALAEVSIVRISPQDFRGIRYLGLMKRYKIVHRLARMVLERLGFDPQDDVQNDEQMSYTAPFWIDMNRLFELYVGARLHEAGLNVVCQDDHSQEFVAMKDQSREPQAVGMLRYRPDYVENDQGIVVDAKYKLILRDRSTPSTADDESSIPLNLGLSDLMTVSPSNGDVYQVIAYRSLLGPQFRTAVLVAPSVAIDNPNVPEWKAWRQKGACLVLPDGGQVVVLACPVPRRQQASTI